MARLQKSKLEIYQSSFPDIIKSIGDYLKTVVSKESLGTLSTSTSTIATIIKVFSKPLIDAAYRELANKQLKEFGLETYLKTSIDFANSCLEKALESEAVILNSDLKNDLIKETLPSVIQNNVDLSSKNPALIFYPKYHPAVVFIKNVYSDFLAKSGVTMVRI